MSQKSVVTNSKPQTIPKSKQTDWGPYLRYNYSLDEKTGNKVFKSVSLSDGDAIGKETAEKSRGVFKKTVGTENPEYGIRILERVAYGMKQDDTEERLNNMAIALAAMRPQDETEAALLGQFVSLQESGFRCLRLANSQEGFYHVERFFQLATKLFNTANQTMQTVAKYRYGGRQEIQIVHVHNQGGQAVVTQTVTKGGGDGNKS